MTRTEVTWHIHRDRLLALSAQIVSRSCSVEVPGYGQVPFAMLLVASGLPSGCGRHAQSFKRSKGKGRVVLKSQRSLEAGSAKLSLRIGLSSLSHGEIKWKPQASHDFSLSCMGGLPAHEEWNFKRTLGHEKYFTVHVHVQAVDS